MADRLRLITSNLGVGNAASSLSSVYSLTPGSNTLTVSHDNGTPFTFNVNGTLQTESIQASQVSIDVGVANTMQMQSMTLTGPLVSNGASLSGNVTLGNPGLLRTDPTTVTLGNTAYIASNSSVFNVQQLAANTSVTAPTVTANTLIANGINILSTIRDAQSSSIRYYVKTTGSDTNDGRSWDKAFRTIKHAALMAQVQYSTIYVESGDYVEETPIWLNKRVSVIGDNLRSTRLFAQNPKTHYFFVDDLCYIYGFRFMDLRRPAFCVTFPCCVAEAEIQFGRISNINVLHSPSGYAAAPTVVIESPDLSYGNPPTATCTLTAKGQVATISLVTSGDTYLGTTPSVTINAPLSATGVQPQANTTLTADAVSSITITEVGTRYTSGTPPTVTIAAPPSGTQALATAALDASGYLASINISDGGSGYASAPTVSITAPAAIQATANVIMNFQGNVGTVTGFTITEAGSGYAAAPQVIVSPPDSIQATATALLTDGVVTGFNITNPGSGYSASVARPHVSVPPPSSKKAFITGSPYIQNCSSITGPFNRSGVKISAATPLPYDLDVYDVDPTGAGGGMLIDGAVCDTNSPLRSMVADSFTQVNQGGPGHLVIFRGYAQFVSCFTTFCTYSYRSVDGGTTNISTSVTDFGIYGLISTGYWRDPTASGTVSTDYRSSVASVTIVNGGSGYTSPPTVVFSGGNPTGNNHAVGNAVLLADRVDSVSIDVGNAGQYESTPTVTFIGGNPTVAATGNVNMSSVNPIRVNNVSLGLNQQKPNQGQVVKYKGVWHTVTSSSFVGLEPDGDSIFDVNFYPAIFTADGGDPLRFYQGSTVGTGQHVMEFVGSGVTYNALLEYGGQPNDANQVLEVFPGRVFYAITDHLGNQRVGPYFGVEQLTGAVTLNTDKFSLSGLEAIGPFRRDGNPAGVRLEEVSNDTRLIDSTGVIGSTTVPTQFAVQTYVTRFSLKPGGSAGSGYVKNSNNDYDASWVPVVLEAEKAQPLGVANIDAQGRIVGDGSVVSNINATNIALGTLNTARLPANIGNISTRYTGDGAGISNINASNIYTGQMEVERIGTGTPAGTGNVVLDTNPLLLSTLGVRGTSPLVTLQDTNHRSAFLECNANLLTMKGGLVNANTPSQVNGQWPFAANLSTNDCTIGGNVLAIGDVVAYASDARLKSNIRPISEHPLEDVQKLRGVRFEWNDRAHFEGTEVGVVAQDVQSVLPEAVRPAPFDPAYLTVDMGNKLTGLLIEAVKELTDRLQQLEQRIRPNE